MTDRTLAVVNPLLAQYPRDTWQALPFGSMAESWLRRHNNFRRWHGQLAALGQAWQAGQLSDSEYDAQFLPQLKSFLSRLTNHHSAEDREYFKTFRRQLDFLLGGMPPDEYAKLTRVYDAMTDEHESLDAQIHQLNAMPTRFYHARQAVASQPDNAAAITAYQAVIADSIVRVEVIRPLLFDHLTHEEDWVIPIMLAANM